MFEKKTILELHNLTNAFNITNLFILQKLIAKTSIFIVKTLNLRL